MFKDIVPENRKEKKGQQKKNVAHNSNNYYIEFRY